MKKVKKWMLGILAATTVVATGCGNHTDMVSVAVIKGVDSAEHVSAAAEAETTEAIRIELAMYYLILLPLPLCRATSMRGGMTQAIISF